MFFILFEFVLVSCVGPKEKVDSEGQAQIFDRISSVQAETNSNQVDLGRLFRVFELTNYFKYQFQNSESEFSIFLNANLSQMDEYQRDLRNSLFEPHSELFAEQIASLTSSLKRTQGSPYSSLTLELIKNLSVMVNQAEIDKISSLYPAYNLSREDIGESSKGKSHADASDQDGLEESLVRAMSNLDETGDFGKFFLEFSKLARVSSFAKIPIVRQSKVFLHVAGFLNDSSIVRRNQLKELLQDSTVSVKSKILVSYSLLFIVEEQKSILDRKQLQALIFFLESFAPSIAEGKRERVNSIITEMKIELAQSFAKDGLFSEGIEILNKDIIPFLESLIAKDSSNQSTNKFYLQSKMLVSVLIFIFSNESEKSISSLEGILSKSIVKDSIQYQALWILALLHIAQGQHDQAIKIFQSEFFNAEIETENPKFMYWLGRAFQSSGDLVRANFYYAGCIASSQASSYYALRSYQHLTKGGKLPPWMPQLDLLKAKLASTTRMAEYGKGWDYFFSLKRFNDLSFAGSQQAKFVAMLVLEAVRLGRVHLVEPIVKAGINSNLFSHLTQDQRVVLVAFLSRILMQVGVHWQTSSLSNIFSVSSEQVYSAFSDQFIVDYPFTAYYSLIEGASQERGLPVELSLSALRRDFFAPKVTFSDTLIGSRLLENVGELPLVQLGAEKVDILSNPRDNLIKGLELLGTIVKDAKDLKSAELLTGYFMGKYFLGALKSRIETLDDDLLVELVESFADTSPIKQAIVAEEVYKDFKTERSTQEN